MTGRPTYERQRDRDNEAALFLRLGRAWNCLVQKREMFSRVDCWAYRNGELKAGIEIKCRTNRMHQYPTYMISKAKYLYAIHEGGRLSVPMLLVVQWADALGYVDLCKAQVMESVGGRVDRGDPMDVESVILIDINQFRRIP